MIKDENSDLNKGMKSTEYVHILIQNSLMFIYLTFSTGKYIV